MPRHQAAQPGDAPENQGFFQQRIKKTLSGKEKHKK
jgi:hypothetical protein